jgi:hypothetical protein
VGLSFYLKSSYQKFRLFFHYADTVGAFPGKKERNPARDGNPLQVE